MADESFGQRLTVALDASPLTLARVSDRLQEMATPCSITTLTSWRLGATLPERESSHRAVANLERLLKTPPGFLTSTTGAACPGTEAWWRAALRHGHHPAPATTPLARWTRDECAPHRRHLLAVVSVFMDDDGTVEAIQRTDVVSAVGGEVATYLLAEAATSDDGAAPGTHVEVLTGGMVDAAGPLADGRGTAYRVVLDRELADGEATLVETRLIPAAPPEPQEASGGAPDVEPVRSGRFDLPLAVPCGQVLIEVRFPALARPSWVRVAREGADEVGAGVQTVALPGTTASASFQAVPGGVVSVEWGEEQA